ncbi:CoA pyrophosphatase [Brevirhabdus sp.]|uniref:CoA pyrophosphatase n=1 Tax=Brevirhabdus sp. TaxID=2004514 RepID=UPI00405893A3
MARIDLIDRVTTALSSTGSASSDFDLTQGLSLPQNRKLRQAGVLIAISQGPADEEVILTKRSSRLRHHPGQIAFPGGKLEPEDSDAIAAALREAEEEVGLQRTQVRVIGTMPDHETVTGFSICPVVGTIDGAFQPVAEAGEVEEVFRVPLAHVLDRARYSVESRMWRMQQRQYYTVPFGPYYIWGATARILRALADRVAL